MRAFRFFVTFLLIALTPAAFSAEKPLLVITGKIAKTNSPDGKSYTFDYAALSQLQPTVIETTTQWTSKAKFKGPLMRDLLKFVGAKADAKTVLVNTLDNYPVTIPVSDFNKWRVVLAYEQDGKRLTVATKGPLWIMYPIDEDPAHLDTHVIAGRLAWAVNAIDVR